MWCLFNILLLFVTVGSSKVFKVWKKEPLVAYIYDANSEAGRNIEKVGDKEWSLLLQRLKESLHIATNKAQLNQFDAIKDQEFQEIKPALRICSYDRPCKGKEVKKEDSREKTKEGECEEQTKDECEGTTEDECEPEQKKDECEAENKEDDCGNDKKKKIRKARHFLF